MRLSQYRRSALGLAGLIAAAAVTLTGCSAPATSDGDAPSYKIGISQYVQHPALDAATAGFKQAFDDAGVAVEWDEQNANNDQSTTVTIAQSFASSDIDLVLAVATPSAQAAAQAMDETPIIFTAVTDPVDADLVKSLDAPGANVTGTSDLAPIDEQFTLLQEVVPGAKKVGIVYSSGEANSLVQVAAAKEAGKELGIEIVEKTVTTGTDIAAATEALGDVDAIYVPTDNMVVSGIGSLVQVAEERKIPVIAAEAGTVEGGAALTLGIDYTKLGYQAGEMALRILEGADPATTPVEISKEFAYVVNEGAAERMGITIPEEILAKADKVD